MTWLFDSHVHLSDPEYDLEIPFIINSMKRMQIKACCVSEDFTSSQRTLALKQQSDLILPFIGVHPTNISNNFEKTLDLIQENTDEISGIGEIGLDRTYVSSEEDFKRQQTIFEKQLSLAEKFQKPISVHSRKALDDIFQIIPSYSIKGILLHWFDGSKKQLKQAMDMQMFVSFGPLLLYAKDKQVLLQNSHKDRVLVETDGPVKFSKCFGFKAAQISFIPSIIFCASKILREGYEELSSILEKNSINFLRT